jgi:IS4 transposase
LGAVRFAVGVTRPACKFTVEELSNWKLLEHFQLLLLPRLKAAGPIPSELDPRRKLAAADYFSLYLFSLLNPVVDSMRGLCVATQFKKMRQVCQGRVSPASFSAGQHLFSPDMLASIVRELAAQAKGTVEFGETRVRQAVEALTLVDGTVLRAVNRMTWAPASGSGCSIRLNLHFSAFDQIPLDWSITPGNISELREWKKRIRPGSFYVGDRLYSEDHLHLKRLKKQGVDFVVRLLGNVIRTAQQEPRGLSAEDRHAGVVSDCVIELGCQGGGPVVRVVEIHAAGKVLLLATTREDLPACLIGLIYRYRWQIELFFKWFKTMLPCQHWLAESPAGVTIQIYCVMIAALLLLLWTGQRPTKRQMEALRLYWMGFVDKEELIAALSSQKKR